MLLGVQWILILTKIPMVTTITKILVSALLLTCALGTILFTTKLTRVQFLWGRLAHASARPHSLNIAAASVTS